MSGTIEQLHAKLDQVLTILAQLSAGNANAQPGITPNPVGGVTGVAGGPNLTGLPATTGAFPSSAPVAAQAVPTVSAEQITALITPHVADPNLKAALQAQMAAMGIGALPDAQPHQYGELYTRFQQVIAQFQAAAAAQPVAAAPASII
jgi:hypothetical protein